MARDTCQLWQITSYRQDSALFDRLSALDSLSQSHQSAQLALRNKPFPSSLNIHRAFSSPFILFTLECRITGPNYDHRDARPQPHLD